MIRLEHVTKKYDQRGRPSVDDLTLHVAEGTTMALIGPSGSGKTTVLRMINRLIEPSSGVIIVDGKEIANVDPVILRRHIGYVIQNVGLFPHLTVDENIAAVPRLLGWDEGKIRQRTEELLHLVGLDAAQIARRYPKHLSGGQRQRIGVARALAADPPILLMDEPFGAIDPIARGRIQNEFKEILAHVRKTVVIVTHDIDEALKLGDTIALMRDGQVIQHDTPNVILQQPADTFVTDFIGADHALRRLELFTVSEVMMLGEIGNAIATISRDATLHQALSKMIALKIDRVMVTDASHVAIGTITRDAILAI
ncbi:ABC transporter ATP-binding protein [Neorhizobium sp. Rsf11]|uniref:ABC transporter ATP-binding protein n=2 Tax=Neorhizobium TaxID=1525371 RepID=A0ABV0MC64_9HYPH|nr:ABC transporter ATP-binding protein [Neorhizobium petrolearium]MCC2613739.1 ABC transporter ATP-binding protein [Neorhizobium petrolearium]WGI72051.1 ABC transporter ATP-binding protein [Neorhizobium petrolearium]